MYTESAFTLGLAGFLGVALAFYAILAGADFGAGMLEWFLGRDRRDQQRNLITEAMGPVWEANHVWLIIAVVILFNGFPRAFSTLCISFHIPLVIMLLGIVLRGCAFTFRHYDTEKDHWQSVYTAIFAVSSVLTPFMLGVVAAGLMLGRIRTDGSYSDRFLAPWLTGFGAALGLFVCTLFAFLAAVYLAGETGDRDLRHRFIRRAKVANGLSVVAGLLVFGAAQMSGLPLVARFLGHPVSVACMVLATLILLPLWFGFSRGWVVVSRALAAGQVVLVLLGWFSLQYPVLIDAPDPITLANAAAPEASLRALFYALVVGSAVILPGLIFLLHVFKVRGAARGISSR